jgi:hypothetical protein
MIFMPLKAIIGLSCIAKRYNVKESKDSPIFFEINIKISNIILGSTKFTIDV